MRNLSLLLCLAFALFACAPATPQARTEDVPVAIAPEATEQATRAIPTGEPKATRPPATARATRTARPAATATVKASPSPSPLPSRTAVPPTRTAVPPSATPAPTSTPLPPTTTPHPDAAGLLPPEGLVPAAVVQVVDGDTIDVNFNGETVRLRLIGMDTPETVDPRTFVQCFGKEASNRATEMLTGQTVLLEADESQGERDTFDRLLRYVWLPDGRLFNLLMVADGFAHEYTYDLPYRYQAQFQQAATEARQALRGLWSPNTCGGNTEQPAVTPTVPAPTAAPQPTPRPAVPPPAPAPSGNCDPSYPTVCIPPYNQVGDLDCGDIPQFARFRVLPPDPHGFDGNDNDGIGCESN